MTWLTDADPLLARSPATHVCWQDMTGGVHWLDLELKERLRSEGAPMDCAGLERGLRRLADATPEGCLVIDEHPEQDVEPEHRPHTAARSYYLLDRLEQLGCSEAYAADTRRLRELYAPWKQALSGQGGHLLRASTVALREQVLTMKKRYRTIHDGTLARLLGPAGGSPDAALRDLRRAKGWYFVDELRAAGSFQSPSGALVVSDACYYDDNNRRHGHVLQEIPTWARWEVRVHTGLTKHDTRDEEEHEDMLFVLALRSDRVPGEIHFDTFEALDEDLCMDTPTLVICDRMRFTGEAWQARIEASRMPGDVAPLELRSDGVYLRVCFATVGVFCQRSERDGVTAIAVRFSPEARHEWYDYDPGEHESFW